MNVSVIALLSHFRREVRFSWKKILWLTVLGVMIGVALVFALPVRVS